VRTCPSALDVQGLGCGMESPSDFAKSLVLQKLRRKAWKRDGRRPSGLAHGNLVIADQLGFFSRNSRWLQVSMLSYCQKLDQR
jgi:hypothetical protein